MTSKPSAEPVNPELKAAPPFGSSRALTILSRLLLCRPAEGTPSPRMLAELSGDQEIHELRRQGVEELLALANAHHVVVRALQGFVQTMPSAGSGHGAHWTVRAVDREHARIENAVSFLRRICGRLEAEGCGVVVIKSLDHWPDLGSDLDLYTNADPGKVVGIMEENFDARLAARSWGDRLANKWNFIVPGLPELVEVHMGRLGQTGEHVALGNSLVARARSAKIGDSVFRVPAAEDRLIICTLQRMYRHFYVRLCDIVDSTTLLETEPVDYDSLRSSAHAAGIWEGVATFLAIVSDYTESYRGEGLNLPASVKAAARFGGDPISFGDGFLRVPILPHSAKLYASELTTLLLKGELSSTLRLSLLPGLATAAAIGVKITGSDKGIW
jgi:hypothetical protein